MDLDWLRMEMGTGGDDIRSDKGIEGLEGVGRNCGASVILSNRDRPSRGDVVGDIGRGWFSCWGVDLAESVDVCTVVERPFEGASSSLLISPSSRIRTSRVMGSARSA